MRCYRPGGRVARVDVDLRDEVDETMPAFFVERVRGFRAQRVQGMADRPTSRSWWPRLAVEDMSGIRFPTNTLCPRFDGCQAIVETIHCSVFLARGNASAAAASSEALRRIQARQSRGRARTPPM